MERIGIRELKARASEVLRSVREEQASYEITYRGQAIAKIVPADDEPQPAETAEAWLDALDALAAEITESWPEGVSVEDAIADVRRAL